MSTFYYTVGPKYDYTSEHARTDVKNITELLTAIRKLEAEDRERSIHGYAVVTYAEAVNIVKRRDLDPRVRVEHFAPEAASHVKGERMGWNVSALVHIGRKETLRMLDSMYGTKYREQALVKLSFLSNLLFIG